MATQKNETEKTEAKNKRKLYCTNTQLLMELEAWRDSNKDEEAKELAEWERTHTTEESRKNDPYQIDYTKRIISDNFARLLLLIGQKVTNHSNFRNYTKETKEDFVSYGILKVIKGLKGYNFKYKNAFAYITTAFFNAYKSECIKHYKQINIKKNLLRKYIADIDAELPQSSVSKCLKNQFNNDTMDEDY